MERQRLTTSYDAEDAWWAVHDLLVTIGEDPERDGLRDTPECTACACAEMFTGFDQDPTEYVERVPGVGHEEIVLVHDILIYPVREYHLLLFHGLAHVGYVPSEDGHVTGLPRMARLVNGYARHPQVQKQFTRQVANVLAEHLQRRRVLAVVEAEHLCTSMRGVRKPGSDTVTSATRGIMRNAATRSEAMSLVLDQWS